MDNLQLLMDHIATVWKCDAERYPALGVMNGGQRRNFLVKHSLLHIGRTTGKIAAVCEDFDHNNKSEPSEETNLQVATIKLFINVLKLAEEIGLSAEDLLSQAPGYVS